MNQLPRAVRRLALIFPPAMHPTSPPLGLACLAAYLRRQLPQMEVRCFDLNLAYFELALAWLQEGRLRLSFQDQDQAATAARVAQALAVLRGGGEAFSDPARYEQAAQDYLRAENLLSPVFSAQARSLAAGKPPAPAVGRFFDRLLSPVLDFAPQAVGLSALFSQQLPFALGLARRLKDQGAVTILGGATLSVMPRPERLLAGPLHEDLGRGLDFLLPGEGELGLKAWLEELARPAPDWRRVPGLIFRQGDEAQAAPPAVVGDLAALPLPDFHDFPLAAYHSPQPVLPYLGARGCFWRRCAFCTHRQTYLRYRQEPAALTAARLLELARLHGVRHFSLVDEMIQPQRFAGLSRALIDAGADLRLAAYARPEKGFTPALLGLMRQAGVRVLMWGLESASQRVLDLMGKGTRINEVSAVLSAAQAAGLANLAFVMFGFPGETGPELEQTLAFLDAHAPCLAAVSKSRFLLLEGAPMLAEPARYGLTRVSPRAGDPLLSIAYDYETSAGLSQAEVDTLYRERLRALNWGWSPHLALLRDHLLLRAEARLG